MTRFQNSIPIFAVLGTSTLMCQATNAQAQVLVAASDDQLLIELAKTVLDAVMGGNYLATAALGVVLTVALAKRYAPGRLGAFLQSDIGGALATFTTSLAGALATALLAGSSPSWSLVKMASGVAFIAAGGYALLKKLAKPRLEAFAITHPWAKPILALIMWVFDKPANIALGDAIKKGDDAVKKEPAPGVIAVVGQPERF
jgi:hypothetical protein